MPRIALVAVVGAIAASSSAMSQPSPAPVAPQGPQAPAEAPAAPKVDPATPGVPHVVYVVLVGMTIIPFTASSFGTIEGGGLGALAALSSGSEVIKENNIPDPAGEVAHGVADLIAAKHGGLVEPPVLLSTQTTGHKVSAQTTPEETARTKAAHYVAVAVTSYWGYGPLGFDMVHYGVTYRAIVQVRDNAADKLLFKYTCNVKPRKTGSPPNHDELLSNGAAGLKSLLVAAGKECVEQTRAATPELQ
jgi:hypothetical protein